MSQEILSKSECTEVILNALNIHKSNNVCVHNFKLKPLKEVLGFMGEYYKLEIVFTIADAKPQTLPFFVKSIPTKNELQRKEVLERDVFKKEVVLYRKISKELRPYRTSKWHADCFYSRPDLLVLENLESLGYRHIAGDFFLPELKSGLQCLASMHATSIIYETKSGCDISKLLKDLCETQVRKENTWFQAGLNAIKAVALAHPKYRTEIYQKFISEELLKSLDPMYDLAKTSAHLRNVLCHRDAWGKNVFFKGVPGEQAECVLVDFQLACLQPPAIDVLFFVHVNTARIQRDEIFDWCLRTYYKKLQESLEEQNLSVENILRWTEFRNSCDTFKLLTLVLCGVCIPLIHLPDGFANDLKSRNPTKYQFYMTENRDDLILGMMENNSKYRQRVAETVEELVDIVLNKNLRNH